MGESAQVLGHGELTATHRPIGYDPVFDEFRVAGPGGGAPPPLTHCPWCDAALAASRRSAWFDRLEQLGLSPDDDLPPDLRSSRWWLDARPAAITGARR
jgi:hypothetical protein